MSKSTENTRAEMMARVLAKCQRQVAQRDDDAGKHDAVIHLVMNEEESDAAQADG